MDGDGDAARQPVSRPKSAAHLEAVADALTELRLRDAILRAKLDGLYAKAQVGIEQAARGDFVEFNAEDVKREGRKQLAAQAGIDYARILRTRESWNDYDEIWSYVAVRNLAAADRLIEPGAG